MLPVDAAGQAASDLIRQAIETDAPCMIGRLGRVELDAVLRCQDPAALPSHPGDQTILKSMRNNAGLFPVDDPNLRAFTHQYLAAISGLDILGSWLPGEVILRTNFLAARIVPMPDLEPYYHPNPWSRSLAGRKVLVIHPFAKSIQYQYTRRRLLFDDPNILPDFELITLPAVQSIAENTGGFDSWFAALQWMMDEMAAVQFEVAIIGAGAYGLPLAAHAKRLGRKSVQLGGATQILFGIRGRRWDRHPVIRSLYNPTWIRPQADEIPLNYKRVEGGCYW